MKQLYVVVFLLLCGFSYAQTTLSGTVMSKTDGLPIPYSTIQASNGENTISDDDGNFSISATTETTLTISSIGFKTQSILVGNKKNITILLEDDTTNLDEVVVTALGLERESKELGYAVQTISSDKLTEVKTVNFLDNLENHTFSFPDSGNTSPYSII